MIQNDLANQVGSLELVFVGNGTKKWLEEHTSIRTKKISILSHKTIHIPLAIKICMRVCEQFYVIVDLLAPKSINVGSEQLNDTVDEASWSTILFNSPEASLDTS